MLLYARLQAPIHATERALERDGTELSLDGALAVKHRLREALTGAVVTPAGLAAFVLAALQLASLPRPAGLAAARVAVQTGAEAVPTTVLGARSDTAVNS